MTKPMKTLKTMLAVSFLSWGAAAAPVPISWTVETSRADPARFDAYQGETICFEAALTSRGEPLEAPAEYSFYWQTNGMGNAFWSAACSPAGAATNVMRATWLPSMDVGAPAYSCFIGSPGEIYHAAFLLRLRPSPGASPNNLPLPAATIDFSRVTVLNSPFATSDELAAEAEARSAADALKADAADTYTKSETDAALVSAGAGVLAAANANMRALHDTLTNDIAQSYGRVQQDLSSLAAAKQNVIADLAGIRAGAYAGATALQSETDPTVPAWAKSANKPTYTASEVGALPSGEQSGLVLRGNPNNVLSVKTRDAPTITVYDLAGTYVGTLTIPRQGTLATTADIPTTMAWTAITSKPSAFTPSAHASTHVTGGSDAISPASIGALPVTGGTITGMLGITYSGAQAGIWTFYRGGNDLHVYNGQVAYKFDATKNGMHTLATTADIPPAVTTPVVARTLEGNHLDRVYTLGQNEQPQFKLVNNESADMVFEVTAPHPNGCFTLDLDPGSSYPSGQLKITFGDGVDRVATWLTACNGNASAPWSMIDRDGVAGRSSGDTLGNYVQFGLAATHYYCEYRRTGNFVNLFVFVTNITPAS